MCIIRMEQNRDKFILLVGEQYWKSAAWETGTEIR
jgi:hypothetical protein